MLPDIINKMITLILMFTLILGNAMIGIESRLPGIIKEAIKSSINKQPEYSNRLLKIREISNCIFEITYTGNDFGVIKVRNTDKIGGKDYKYIFYDKEPMTVALTDGNGVYEISSYSVYLTSNNNEVISSTGEIININITDFSNNVFTESTSIVNFSNSIDYINKNTADLKTPLDVFNYVSTFRYDFELANKIQYGIVTEHNVDIVGTMENKSGICLDLAITMAGILRTKGFPSQVIYGYLSNGEYHSWVRVYIDNSWVSFDPTLNKTSYKDDFSNYLITEIH